MNTPNSLFPSGFLWGAATASYQIEGAFDSEGKGLSIWDMFCRWPGKVWHGQNANVGCDHYHRMEEDVALMADLSLRSYRFSVSWPRVLPEGVGTTNQAGLDFYDRLVDALLARNIVPNLTLYHWDLPYALYQRGGWLNPDSPRWFADYANVVAERLGDRVPMWATFNEPQIFTQLGLVDGGHAPGLRLPNHDILRVAHHILLAHGRATQALRANAAPRIAVGIAPVGLISYPASHDPADIAAAEAETFRAGPGIMNMSWWMEPLLHGRYPADGLEANAADLPSFTEEDFDTIRQPLDFLGTNIYHGTMVRAGAGGEAVKVDKPMGYAHSGFYEWPVTPEALYWGATWMQKRSRLPLYITENGSSLPDRIHLDGQVHDPARIDYLERYLHALGRAIQDGADVRGYYVWSLMDNFEWSEGVKARFGLVFIDFPTRRRIPKDSAYWYRDLIRAGGAGLRPA